MPGFPNRSPRSAWGMRKEMQGGIQNPAVELGPDPINLLFDQACGGGYTAPLIVVALNFSTVKIDWLRSVAADDEEVIQFSQLSPTTFQVRVRTVGYRGMTGSVVTQSDIGNDPSLSPDAAAPFALDLMEDSTHNDDQGVHVIGAGYSIDSWFSFTVEVSVEGARGIVYGAVWARNGFIFD